jgi:hypothetical protein
VSERDVNGSASARHRKLHAALVCVALAAVVLVWAARKPEDDPDPVDTRPGPDETLPGDADGLGAVAEPTLPHDGQDAADDLQDDRDRPGVAIPQQPADAEEPAGIETGYYFHMGRYVPPPYKLTIADYKVLINGKYVVSNWGEPRRPKVGVPEDPGEFEWTEAKLKQHIGLTGFLEHASARRRCWILEHGYAQAREKNIQYYRAQPTVKDVEVTGKTSMRIIGVHGERFIVSWGRGPGSFHEWMKKHYAPTEAEAELRHKEVISEAMVNLEMSREGCERSLKRGSAIFNFSPEGGATFTVARTRAEMRVQQIGRILRSAKSKEEKIEALKDIHPDERFGMPIVENWGGVWPEVAVEERPNERH